MHIAEDYLGVEYVVVSHVVQPWPTRRINVSGAVFRHALRYEIQPWHGGLPLNLSASPVTLVLLLNGKVFMLNNNYYL